MSRTDFEAAYIERYGHRPRGWSDDFQVYQDAHANGAWFGWQAGAAGIEAKAAPVGEREAFEHLVVSVTDPDNRTTTEYVITESVVLSLWKRIAELEGNHDTKGSRKSLGAMNAKLRAKVGRLERELTLAQSERVPAWITVSERLPEPCTDVLAYGVNHRSHSYVVAGVFSGTWASQETEEATRFEPTHWMPLPAAPEVV